VVPPWAHAAARKYVAVSVAEFGYVELYTTVWAERKSVDSGVSGMAGVKAGGVSAVRLVGGAEGWHFSDKLRV
jgi:hypothetical protein